MPLDMLVAGGILGLLTYLTIFVACLYVIWKSRRDIFEKAILVGLLSAYFFQNLFVFDNLVSYFFFFAVLSYLYFTETNEKDEKVKRTNEKDEYIMSEDLKNILAILIVLSLGFAVYWINVRPIKANILLIKAMVGREYSTKDKAVVSITPEKTMEYFENALAYNTFANPEIREQLLQKAQNVGYSEGVSEETKLTYINLALKEMDNQIESTPEDARYYIFTGSFLNNISRSDLALPYLEKAKELSPSKPAIVYELVSAYIGVGEKDKALLEAKRIYELDKTIENSKMLYISTLIINNDEKTALELLGSNTSNSEMITRAYVVRAVDAYKKGLLAQAVAEVNKAIKINPSFETTGKQFINAIWTQTLQLE